MKACWRDQIDMAELETMPPKGNLGTIIKWGIPVLIVALLIYGFFMAGADAGTEMIKYWVAANALMAALGALIAFAHPLTIISAALASPITSLNPMIAAGWVAGIIQVFISKPKVKDFDSLQDDISSIKGFWHNKITRILLVVVFTNLGSSLGAWIAIPLMIRAFGG